jgi:hypothetical protein
METNSWVTVWGFYCAILAASLSFAISLVKVHWYKSGSSWTHSSPVLDGLRGAAAFPLVLFICSPISPELGQLVLKEEPLVVALGAAGDLFMLIVDWWRNS